MLYIIHFGIAKSLRDMIVTRSAKALHLAHVKVRIDLSVFTSSGRSILLRSYVELILYTSVSFFIYQRR